MSRRIAAHPLITLERDEVTELPSPGIVASGPLTSDALTAAIQRRLGVESLAFYDAIAPIVDGESIDLTVAFRQSRWDKETMAGEGVADGEEGAYLNCPMSREQYEAFLDALIAGISRGQASTRANTRGMQPVEERPGGVDAALRTAKTIGTARPAQRREAWGWQLRREARDG